MGNITNLKRDGHATGINYTYPGNRLTSLSGALQGDYTYDLNGNATKDRTGMNFAYNHLNLPDSVWNSGGTVKVGYLYDALGTKLRKIATAGGTTTWRDYVGGIEYSKVGSAARAVKKHKYFATGRLALHHRNHQSAESVETLAHVAVSII